MSRETLSWLNTMVLVGYGHRAWHFSAADQGKEPNHYDGPIPADDIRRRLFGWDLIPVELQYEVGGKTYTDNERVGFAHSTSGDLLGVHSRKYQPHQFRDSLLGGVQKITGAEVGINSAGLLAKGAIGWVSVSMADTITTQSGVEFLTSLLAFGSHNGKFPTSYKLVNTLVVCDNTLAMALGEGGPEYKIRHTKNSEIRIENAQQALGLITAGQSAFDQVIQTLCETTVTNAQWARFVEKMAPIAPDAAEGRALTMAENKREKLHTLWNSDPRVMPWKNTKFGVLQAANTYQHHEAIVRGAERAERNMLATLDGSWEKFDAEIMALMNSVLV